MKNLLVLGLMIIAIVSSCDQKQRYTQKSPEIDTYKKIIKDYELRNWENLASKYADTAKIQNNTTLKNAQTIAQLVSQYKQDALLFSSWNFVSKESEYEMVITDKGQTWVNFWGLWQGKLIANNVLYEVPVHVTIQFIDGKIVREHGYWDNSKLMFDIQKMQQSETDKSKEKPKQITK